MLQENVKCCPLISIKTPIIIRNFNGNKLHFLLYSCHRKCDDYINFGKNKQEALQKHTLGISKQ